MARIFLFHLLLLLFYFFTALSAESCGPWSSYCRDRFACPPHDCLQRSQLCDGTSDCPGGIDEGVRLNCKIDIMHQCGRMVLYCSEGSVSIVCIRGEERRACSWYGRLISPLFLCSVANIQVTSRIEQCPPLTVVVECPFPWISCVIATSTAYLQWMNRIFVKVIRCMF